ncbi:hypothetical protein THIOKS11640002 [Thiocapsa sp. KS1]|nr:hypothetical protein THIOKS11640002 [Thiocapsa sp. KS1]
MLEFIFNRNVIWIRTNRICHYLTLLSYLVVIYPTYLALTRSGLHAWLPVLDRTQSST